MKLIINLLLKNLVLEQRSKKENIIYLMIGFYMEMTMQKNFLIIFIYIISNIITSFFYFFELYSMCFLTRFRLHTLVYTCMFCSKFCCSIFKDRCSSARSPSRDSFAIISQRFSFVKYFFKNF